MDDAEKKKLKQEKKREMSSAMARAALSVALAENALDVDKIRGQLENVRRGRV